MSLYCEDAATLGANNILLTAWAWWALMHHFLSVCDLTKIQTWPKFRLDQGSLDQKSMAWHTKANDLTKSHYTKCHDRLDIQKAKSQWLYQNSDLTNSHWTKSQWLDKKAKSQWLKEKSNSLNILNAWRSTGHNTMSVHVTCMLRNILCLYNAS